MTYCVGLLLDQGLVFMSDTRTNAGVDNISTVTKMKIWSRPGDRFLICSDGVSDELDDDALATVLDGQVIIAPGFESTIPNGQARITGGFSIEEARSLAKQLIEKYDLSAGHEPQKFGIGMKEIWEIDPAKHKEGAVVHTMGWPLGKNAGGGSFIYHAENNQVFIGFVVHLNYANPYLYPYAEFQRFTQHRTRETPCGVGISGQESQRGDVLVHGQRDMSTRRQRDTLRRTSIAMRSGESLDTLCRLTDREPDLRGIDATRIPLCRSTLRRPQRQPPPQFPTSRPHHGQPCSGNR